ncbi:ATP-binding cassette domain-containing protein [Pedobacter montanisoli]|uniref:ATP-binding cassette domain-containing protein n=1 Tax=Pedobacter montanisoli TaxID=2923277 RepID=A0ABS9ZWW2_9SPHI|nr:ATP-binding cassette domain-containing protein [Pedobacter montanisoli]MCJ0742803.1 ATP-binding cassette domain-containing protein [Pedobacter montanisoli]
MNWIINRDENWYLGGESGSGKSVLLTAIADKDKKTEIQVNVLNKSKLKPVCLYISQWYQFKNLEGVANFYYQQRYNKQQLKDTLTVGQELALYGKENQLDFTELDQILIALNFSSFKDAQLIELSSGEHKKLQLIKAIWLKPQLLLLDQPYTGLDINSRTNLNILLDYLASQGVRFVIACSEHELPKCINKYACIENGQIKELNGVLPVVRTIPLITKVPSFLQQTPKPNADVMVKMVNVNISYGDKQVIKNLNWEVKAGEKWLLQGHNGSGKSTLLSLVNGDHPQSYANELYLFGSKRGSGESIWDIKSHIGLISPELHWYFDKEASVWQSIASGFFDSVGLFNNLGYHKTQQVNELLDYFGLTEDKNELLVNLSLGKQRLALLARTLIKNPELLVLDEPCQGLDEQQTAHFNQLIDGICSTERTLIYVSHNQQQLPQKLTHRLVLNQGEVIENSTYNLEKELA